MQDKIILQWTLFQLNLCEIPYNPKGVSVTDFAMFAKETTYFLYNYWLTD